MKKIFIAFVAVACALSACSDDDTADDLSRATISITPDAIPAGPDGTTTQVTVTSSGDWRLAGVCDWVHPSAESGKSGDVVTFTIDPNTSEESREAAFKFFTGSAVAPLKITSEPGYSLTLISEDNMTVEATETGINVKVHTNIPELSYSFSDGGEEWISFSDRIEAFGNTILNFTLTENPTYDDRASTITIAGEGLELRVAVVQRQIDAINIGDTSFEFDLSERTFSVDVSANVDYTVTIDSDWITQKPGTRGLVTEALSFHLDAAPTNRGGKITIEGGGITHVLTVIQKDPNAKVAYFADENFVTWLSENGWIVALGPTSGIVLEKGLNATELSFSPGWYDTQWISVDGIENFPNLAKINVTGNNLTKVDISKLTKVKSLVVERMYYLSEIHLGDNPIVALNPFGYYGYVAVGKFTVSGTQLATLDLSLFDSFWNYDSITEVDVSGCPALQTLKCDRGEKVETLYYKTGQEIPNLTKNDATQIVYVD
ncbi:BACON domain-containing protein [Alistipes onderdonkii]|uniref:BACON domain-containing protein n=1 Tax=Alistipes onderdonkii TaxID=328813 RepID=UPI0036F2D77C